MPELVVVVAADAIDRWERARHEEVPQVAQLGDMRRVEVLGAGRPVKGEARWASEVRKTEGAEVVEEGTGGRPRRGRSPKIESHLLEAHWRRLQLTYCWSPVLLRCNPLGSIRMRMRSFAKVRRRRAPHIALESSFSGKTWNLFERHREEYFPDRIYSDFVASSIPYSHWTSTEQMSESNTGIFQASRGVSLFIFKIRPH